jgi:hypothetical protein
MDKTAGTYGLYLQSNFGFVPASGHASGLNSEVAPFNAYEYGQVIRANMKQDDFSHPGTWRVRGTVRKSSANKLLGDFLRFTVLD